MRQALYIESRTPGVLIVNGCFCGPLEGEGQAFPVGRNVEVYIQLFPFMQGMLPLTVAMRLTDGQVERLEPREAAYALLWPDGAIQLELRARALPGGHGPEDEQTPAGGTERAAAGALLRYLTGRLAGDASVQALCMRPQEVPDLSGYEAVVPLRFAPMEAPERFDERAGLLCRLAPNVARIDAALAVTVPAGQGRRMIEHIEIMRSAPR